MIIKMMVNDEEFMTLWNGLQLYKDASKYLTYSYQQQCVEDIVNPLLCMMNEAYHEAGRGEHNE